MTENKSNGFRDEQKLERILTVSIDKYAASVDEGRNSYDLKAYFGSCYADSFPKGLEDTFPDEAVAVVELNLIYDRGNNRYSATGVALIPKSKGAPYR